MATTLEGSVLDWILDLKREVSSLKSRVEALEGPSKTANGTPYCIPGELDRGDWRCICMFEAGSILQGKTCPVHNKTIPILEEQSA